MADIYQKYDDKSGEFADFGDLKARKDIGIVEDTDIAEHTIAAGQYVIWKGNLYTANSAITPDTALSTSNLRQVTIGGFNDLKNKISSLDEKNPFLITTQVENPNDAPIGVSTSHNVFDTQTWCTLITYGNTLYPNFKQQIAIPWFSQSLLSKTMIRIYDGSSWGSWHSISFSN